VFLALALILAACARPLTPEQRAKTLEQGDAALESGDLQAAERWFSSAADSDPNDSRALFGLGLTRLRLQGAAQALPLFEKAAKLDTGDFNYGYLHAHTLALVGRREDAIQAYRALIDKHPTQLRPLLEMLDQLVEARRLDEAGQIVAQALERSPREFSLLVMAGKIQGLKGDQPASAAEYQKAREIRPYATQPVYGLIEAYRGMGRIKESAELIKVFEDLSSRQKELDAMEALAAGDPSNAEPALRFIQRLFELNRLDDAVEKTQDFLGQFPGRSENDALALKAAHAATRIGNLDAARALLRSAEAVDSRRSPEDLIVLANLHEGVGEFEQALEIYDRLLQERPDDPRALTGMGKTAMHDGRLDLAEPPLRRALALSPRDAGAHAALGLLLIKKGNARDAASELNSALGLDAEEADALFGLGFLAHQRRDNDQAEKFLRRALARRPGDGNAQVVLALVLSEKGRCPEAIPLFTSALASDYRNMTSHMGLVRCLEQAGRTAEAAQQRKIAEEILGRNPADKTP
jgi:tetratricopeptide (TPR) repeat protein